MTVDYHIIMSIDMVTFIIQLITKQKNFVDSSLMKYKLSHKILKEFVVDLRANIPRYGTSVEHYKCYTEYLFKRHFVHETFCT